MDLLSYDPGTGAFTYTGPGAPEVRAHISGGYGIELKHDIATCNRRKRII